MDPPKRIGCGLSASFARAMPRQPSHSFPRARSRTSFQLFILSQNSEKPCFVCSSFHNSSRRTAARTLPSRHSRSTISPYARTRRRSPRDEIRDIIVPTVHFTKDNGELTSITLDENSKVEVVG